MANLTEQQTAIIMAASNGTSIQGIAGPGCGKTYLLTEFMRANAKSVGIALAFGADIAAELTKRIPENARWLARTTHQFGKASFPARKRIDAKGAKLKRLFELRYDGSPYTKHRGAILALTRTLREYAYGFSPGVTDADIPDLIVSADIDIEPGYTDMVIKAATTLVDDADADLSEIDFTDMLRQPVLRKYKFPSLEYILIDEMQDWSVLQRNLLAHALSFSPNATILGVGDPKQAIFAFRGADASSFERMQEAFRLTQMPLNRTWRCPQSICDLANTIYPDALVPMSTIEGRVSTITHAEFTQCVKLTDASVVLCRTNAPLFAVARQRISARKPFRIKPTYPRMLENIVRRMQAATVDELILRLHEAAHTAEDNARTPTQATYQVDKYESLLALCQGAISVQGVIDLLRKLTQGTEGPRLSTIHGIKGLEAPHVYLIRPDLCPHPAAKTEVDTTQERNLKFVAITRAQETLTFVTPPNRKQ